MPADRCDLLCLDLPKAEDLRQRRLSSSDAAFAAERSKALSDPTRLTIAAALRDGGELCVCDISWVCERPQALVSHHMRVLRTAGLVVGRRDGKMMMYALTDAGVALVDVVLGPVEASA